MTLNDVKQQFRSSEYEMKGGDHNSYSIISKKGPPYELAGSISFYDTGKIYWIGKSWGTFQGSMALSIAREIFNCFNQEKSHVVLTRHNSE